MGNSMGGFGSGGWRSRGAGRCEHHLRLDLAFLDKCASGLRTMSWSRGGVSAGSIVFWTRPDRLCLTYRVRNYGEEEWTQIQEHIFFAWTRTAFNGRRRWFVCPRCGRNCRILYGGAYFRCRQCHRLTYESQYEEAYERPLTHALKRRRRLGGSGSIEDPFPPKPKGVHWKTYRRLEAEDDRAQDLWAAGILAWMAGSLG